MPFMSVKLWSHAEKWVLDLSHMILYPNNEKALLIRHHATTTAGKIHANGDILSTLIGVTCNDSSACVRQKPFEGLFAFPPSHSRKQ